MDIYEVPKDRRHWVVRAERGRYYDHFSRFGVVALGHLNPLNIPNTQPGGVQAGWGEIERRASAYQLADTSRKERLHLPQARAFVFDMKVGDWVIAIGNGAVRFGRVISSAYIDKAPLEIVYDAERDLRVSCDMHLRRVVQWGPSLNRQNLPYGLQLSLKANQTLFSVDARWEALYHTLFAAFMRDGRLFLSAKIKSLDPIRNQDIAKVFQLLDEVEAIGKTAAQPGGLEEAEVHLERLLDSNSLTITTKAQFHSPGEIWNTITGFLGASAGGIPNWAYMTVLIYAMIFGNQKLGFDGVVDIETRKKLWDLAIARLKKNKAENVVGALQIELPTINTEALRDGSKDQK